MDVSTEKLHVAVDYGTTTLSVAFWKSSGNDKPTNVLQLPLDNQRHTTAPQILAYHNNQLVWGHSLTVLLKKRKISNEDVIRNLKLYLYPEYRLTDNGQKIRNQLAKLKKHDYDVIGEHLTSVLALVKPWLKKTPTLLSRTTEQIDSMDIELLLLVPACWDRSGMGTMTAAAKIAGVKCCQVVTESRVSLFALRKAEYEDMPENATIITVDGGGGTLDCASLEILDSQNNRRIVATEDRPPSACPAGSELVDEMLFSWLFDSQTPNETGCSEIQSYGGIDAFLEEFQISKSVIRTESPEQFKTIKEQFEGDEEEDLKIWLHFPEATYPHFTITLSPEIIKTFFEPILQTWIKTLNAMCGEGTKAMLLNGGFSQNLYLQSRLKAEFEPKVMVMLPTDAYEIAKPQLSSSVQELFRCVLSMPLPNGLTWGLEGNEVYNAKVHPHCKLPQKGKGKNKPYNENMLYRVPGNGKRSVVLAGHVIEWLIHPESEIDSQEPRKASKQLVFDIAEDERFIEVDVVYTSRSGVQHEPLWDVDGNLRDGFNLVDPQPTFHLPELEDLSYVADHDTNGLKWYRDVTVKLDLEVQPKEVKLRLCVAQSPVIPCPSTNNSKKISSPCVSTPTSWVWEHDLIIWDMWMANIVRDTTSLQLEGPTTGVKGEGRNEDDHEIPEGGSNNGQELHDRGQPMARRGGGAQMPKRRRID